VRPEPSQVPLLRIVSVVMFLLAVLFAAQLTRHRSESGVTIESRYVDATFRHRLLDGLQWLDASALPGGAMKQPGLCLPKIAKTAAKNEHRFRCAREALNTRLATASTPHYIQEILPEEPDQGYVLQTMQWLTRNARDGDHALSLIRAKEQTTKEITLADPFRLPGCLLAGANTVASPAKTGVCAGDAAAIEAASPPHIQGLLYPVHQYMAATRSGSPNTLHWKFAPGLATSLAQGRHVTVAWDAQTQDRAQATAACYAGDHVACARCSWCNKTRSDVMYEAARVRAIGILIVDVRTGAIEASASAYTRCFSARQRGSRTPVGCPSFPSMPGNKQPDRSFRLGNQALLQTAMPGSLAKLPIALGLLQAGLSPREIAALPKILTRSATEELIDIALCKVQGFLPSCAHHRLTSIARVASGIGWQRQTDVLTLGQVENLSSPQFGARLMQLPSKNDASTVIQMLNQAAMRQCGLKPTNNRWRNCHTEDLVNTVAELFGQGNALSSPIGIANGMLQIAAAANGETASSSAHLLNAVQDSAGKYHSVGTRLPLAFRAANVRPVLLGLSRTQTEGTARSACLAARAASRQGDWLIPCSPQEMRDSKLPILRIAGKTGTPVFSADRLTLPLWRSSCEEVAKELANSRKGQIRWHHLRNEHAKCQMAPIKWYAVLVGQPETRTWDKIMVVIAERNWNRTTQKVDSARDVDANVAAEVGLALGNLLYGNTKPTARNQVR